MISESMNLLVFLRQNLATPYERKAKREQIKKCLNFIENFPQIKVEFWRVHHQPLMKIVGNAHNFCLIASCMFPKSPHVHLDCLRVDKSKIGVEIGVFIVNPFFHTRPKNLDKGGKPFFCLLETVFSNPIIESLE